MLGEPMPKEDVAVDIEKDDNLTFAFDIAIAPEFTAQLTAKDKIDYYKITIDDKLINDQIDMYASRAGKYDKVEVFEGKDMLKGTLTELGVENPLVVEDAVIMPDYIKNDDQKKLFEGSKVNDVVTINPSVAYDSDVEISSLLKITKEDVANHKGEFTYQITEITRFKKAEVNQELFDSVFGKDAVKSEEEFKQKIAEGLKTQLEVNSDYKFLQDVRAHMEKKVGKLEWPEALLKKIMLNNNKDKGEDFVEKNYEGSVKELGWHLIKEQLVKASDIKIDDKDVLETAKGAVRAQFAQYGMSNVPDELVENYAKEQISKKENVDSLVDRAIDLKLIDALKKLVKLNEKEITLDEFNKMMA
jgi:trigger factor